jgi:hypothetical protein
MARAGLDALAQARRARKAVPKAAAPALLAGVQAGPILHQAARDPARIDHGALGTSEFRRRFTLLLRGLSQRW